MSLEVRSAASDDIDAVVDVLAEVSAWLRTRGIRQWPARFPAYFFDGYVRRGELYVAIIEDDIVGTITLQWLDPAFWGDRQDAGFVHRLAVRRSHAGWGRTLLDWAERKAVEQGRSFLCLDTLSTNTRLRRYYQDVGFCAVGEISGPADHPTDPTLDTWRAVLYEKAIGQPRV